MAFDKKIRIVIQVDNMQAVAGLKTATTQLDTMNKTLGRVIRSMTAFAALWGLRKLIGGIGDSVKGFAEFEKGISNVGILLDENIDRLKDWENVIKETSVQWGLSIEELNKSAFKAQSAIGDVDKSIDVFKAGAMGAVAGGADIKDTINGLIIVMEHYGDKVGSATRAMDMLMKAQKFANADIGELAGSITKFLPVMSTMGVSLEEGLAIMAQMTRALGNAKEAATALGMMFQKLLGPTGVMKDAAAEEWGMTIQQVLAKYDLIAVLKQLNKVEIDELQAMWSRVRAIKGATSTTKDLAKETGFAKEILDSEGETLKKANMQMETTQKQLDVTAESWHSFSRAVGEFIAKKTPLVATLKDAAGALSDFANETDESTKNVNEGFGDPESNIGLFVSYMQRLGSSAGITNPLLLETAFNLRKIKEEINQIPENAVDIGKIVVKPGEGEGEGTEEEKPSIFKTWAEEAETYGPQIDNIFKGIKDTIEDTTKTFKSSFGKAFADMLLEGKSFKTAMQDVWKSVSRTFIEGLGEMIAELALWVVKSMLIQQSMIPPLIAMAKTIEIAWAGAAANVSLATLGGNAAPAMAGIASTKAMAAGLALLQEGGLVPGIGRGDRVPALLEPGELVIPRDKVQNVVNNSFSSSPNITVSMAGAIVTDDPVAIQRLYRDGLRDVIMRDIRTGRDKFYNG